MRKSTLVLAGICSLALAAPVLAQNPNARGPRKPRTPTTKTSTTTTTGTAGRTALPVGAVLASWLDDADTLEPGRVSMGFSVGRWSALDGGESDAPAADVSVGLVRGVQLSASLPYSRAGYSDGFRSSGLGDSYFVAKVRLIDPGQHAVGLAISPTVEVLSKNAVSDTTLGLSRTNFALPVSIEVDRDEIRAYATAGYFSRGAVSLGAAVERPVTERVTLVGTLTYSHTTKSLSTSDLGDLSRSRTDVAGGVYLRVTPVVTVSGSLGRTISRLDQNGARLTATAGISILTGRSKPIP
jgi:hypothetical protein